MDLFSDLPDPNGKDSTDGKDSTTFDPKITSKLEILESKESATLPGSIKDEASSLKRKQDDAFGSDAPVKEVKASPWYRMKGFLAERKGEREEMQDAHVILNDFSAEFNNLPPTVERLAYYGVFDGHCGRRASQHASKVLHKHLIAKFPQQNVVSLDKEIKKCLIDTFKATDDEFLKMASAQKPAWKDGSTALCVLTVNNTLYIANLGDSRALLCRYNDEKQGYQLIPLSKEHNPTQYEERMRIQKAGGTVRDGRLMGVLEVSRSIGDGRFKHCGVTCIPDIKKCQLGDKDRYLLLACDGLWSGFNSETAKDLINKILDDTDVKPVEGKCMEDVRYEVTCNKLASEAIRRGSSDNVTVILVRIGGS